MKHNARRRRREGDPLYAQGLVALWMAGQGLYTTYNGTTLAVADADPVGGWEPVYGTQKLIQSSDTLRPLFKTGVTPNGRNAVLFDGTDDTLAVTSAMGMASIPTMTVVVVCKPSAVGGSTGYKRIVSFYTTTLKYRTLRSDQNPVFCWAYKQDDATNNSFNFGVPTVNWFCLAVRDAAGVVDNWVNGTKGTQNTYTASATTMASFGLGSGASGSLPFAGHIACVAVYNQALTDAQITDISKYLMNRYGF